MKRTLTPAVLLFLALMLRASGADQPSTPPPATPPNPAPAPKQATPEEIKARLAEHTRKKAAEAAEAAKAERRDTPPPLTAPVAPAPSASAASAGTPKLPAQEAPTVLPKVEVRKGKITKLDEELSKQNEEIARERKNEKPTPLDETLNGPGVSKALAIFGGQSSDDRANVSKERVAMMEEERDMIEAIAQARTPQEKAELEKTLADMRAMRRELEQSLH